MKANRPTDLVAVVDVIDPDATAAGAVNGSWVSAADFSSFMAIVMAGTLGASATLDFKIEQATDASGTGAKDITGKAVTQITQGGTNQSDTQAIVEFCGEDLDVDNDFTHVRMVMTVGAATSDAGAVLMGLDARYGPASDRDAASVGEIIGLDA
jgi:hypothetical protein